LYETTVACRPAIVSRVTVTPGVWAAASANPDPALAPSILKRLSRAPLWLAPEPWLAPLLPLPPWPPPPELVALLPPLLGAAVAAAHADKQRTAIKTALHITLASAHGLLKDHPRCSCIHGLCCVSQTAPKADERIFVPLLPSSVNDSMTGAKHYLALRLIA
jgi:hypothetical protein